MFISSLYLASPDTAENDTAETRAGTGFRGYDPPMKTIQWAR